jgi:glucose uptake protein
MFIVQSYQLAVALCFVTMICWGSWANTQKLAGKTWRFELFYWDYVLGVVLMSLLIAFTLGSSGSLGRGFLADLHQADAANLGSALLGGVVFNLANILLVAAIAISGMAVAFPVGIGLALVLGVLINYVGGDRSGNATLLFLGVVLIALSIMLDAVAYRKLPGQRASGGAKGLALSVACGILMSMFYFLVARSIGKVELPTAKGMELVTVTAQHLQAGTLQAGKMTPFTANVIFALGILLSNFVFNTAIMMKPFVGSPIPLADYFKGRFGDHLWGIVGGGIWGIGMGLNIVAADAATSAVSYGLGQGATLVAAIWGVFIWREFREAPPGTNRLLALMFVGYVVGLALVIAAKAT